MPLFGLAGNQLSSILGGVTWPALKELLNAPDIANPLRQAVTDRINDRVHAALPGTEVVIMSSEFVSQVLGLLHPWLAEYSNWLSLHTAYKSVTAEGMCGMMLWHLLAEDKSRDWTVEKLPTTKKYTHTRAQATDSSATISRQELVELRAALRQCLVKLDALLGQQHTEEPW